MASNLITNKTATPSPSALSHRAAAASGRGMLLLRQAQLERELQQQRHHLLGVEARLRHIAQEDCTPADDVVIKQIPPLDVVAIAENCPGRARRTLYRQ